MFNSLQAWTPIQELQRPDTSSVSLIIISSHRNFHSQESYDPIFPAHKHNPSQALPWLNDEPYATVLGCVDTIKLCTPNGSTCWDRLSPPHIPLDDLPGYFLLSWALDGISVVAALKYTAGAALNATSKLCQFGSLPLTDNQWRVEAEQMFTSSLARVQLAARNIAFGYQARYPGFVNIMANSTTLMMCGSFKFNSTGFTNLSENALVLAIVFSSLVFLFGYKAGDWRTRLWTRIVSPCHALASNKYFTVVCDILRWIGRNAITIFVSPLFRCGKYLIGIGKDAVISKKVWLKWWEFLVGLPKTVKDACTLGWRIVRRDPSDEV